MSIPTISFLKGEILLIDHKYKGRFRCEFEEQIDTTSIRVIVYENVQGMAKNVVYRTGERMYVNIANCKEIKLLS